MKRLLAFALLVLAAAADAQTLRWAAQGDPQTMDPHSQNESMTNVRTARSTTPRRPRPQLKIVPGLATEWQQVGPDLALQAAPGVKFHDGTPFTADDVVFSVDARQRRPRRSTTTRPASARRRRSTISRSSSVAGPNPIFLEHVDTLYIMSKAWCEKNKVDAAAGLHEQGGELRGAQRERHRPLHAASRASPTSRRCSSATRTGGARSRATSRRWSTRRSQSTRRALAALISGEVDFVLDPPPQRHRAAAQRRRASRCIDGPREPHRLHRHGPGARRAAVLQRQGQEPVQGQARAPGALPGDRHRGDQDASSCAARRADRRGDAVAARRLQRPRAREAPAVRPRGGEEADGRGRLPERLRGARSIARTTATSTTRRSARRSAAMWAQIERQGRVDAMPRAIYFPKLEKLDTSMYMLGWGGSVDRCRDHADAGAPHPRHGRRRRLQLRPGQQRQARRSWPAHRASSPIRRSARRSSRRRSRIQRPGPHDPAAPPVDPVGRAARMSTSCTAPTTGSKSPGSR